MFLLQYYEKILYKKKQKSFFSMNGENKLYVIKLQTY